MTRSEVKPSIATVKELMAQEPDGLREIMRCVMQAMLEAEMDEAVGAGKGEINVASRRIGHNPFNPRSGKIAPRIRHLGWLVLDDPITNAWFSTA